MGGSYYRVKEGEPTGGIPPHCRQQNVISLLWRTWWAALYSQQWAARWLPEQPDFNAVERLMQRSDRSYPISKLRLLSRSRMILKPNVMDLKPVLAVDAGGRVWLGVRQSGRHVYVDNLDVFGIDGTEFLDNKVWPVLLHSISSIGSLCWLMVAASYLHGWVLAMDQ